MKTRIYVRSTAKDRGFVFMVPMFMKSIFKQINIIFIRPIISSHSEDEESPCYLLVVVM